MLEGHPVLVNGELGLYLPGTPTVAPSVNVFSLEGGRISGIYGVLNPEKLTRLPA
jgi:RNA polymerase sigma-70 factor (ECF subfamily)